MKIAENVHKIRMEELKELRLVRRIEMGEKL